MTYMYIATENGLEHVTRNPASPAKFPIRLFVRTFADGQWGGVEEFAYATLEHARADLDDMGTRVEDIVLEACEGARPKDLGFDEAY